MNTRTYLLIDLFRDSPVISGSGKYVNTASFLDGVTPETFTLVGVSFKSPFRGLVTHVIFTAVMLVAGSLYSFALCTRRETILKRLREVVKRVDLS